MKLDAVIEKLNDALRILEEEKANKRSIISTPGPTMRCSYCSATLGEIVYRSVGYDGYWFCCQSCKNAMELDMRLRQMDRGR
jgi:hypothetical protein